MRVAADPLKTQAVKKVVAFFHCARLPLKKGDHNSLGLSQ